jgi:P27 family predicted phage terminase small subunit
MPRLKTVPDSQKVLQGHSRFVKNVPEIKPIDRMWPVDKSLGKSGQWLWTNIGPLLVRAKMLTDLDRPTWTLLCKSRDIIDTADRTTDQEGFSVVGHGGIKKSHPALRARQDAVNTYIRLAEKFGLSPVDRNKIDLKVDDNPQDKTRDFLFGGKKCSQ